MINIPFDIQAEYEGQWKVVDDAMLRTMILEALCCQKTLRGFIHYMEFGMTDEHSHLLAGDVSKLTDFFNTFTAYHKA